MSTVVQSQRPAFAICGLCCGSAKLPKSDLDNFDGEDAAPFSSGQLFSKVSKTGISRARASSEQKRHVCPWYVGAARRFLKAVDDWPDSLVVK